MQDKHTPTIGITANLFPAESRAHYNGKALHVFDEQLVSAIADAGGTPLLLPNRSDVVATLLPLLDGLLVSAGADVAPSSYGAEPTQWLGQPERDDVEILWIRSAVERGLPILGVCRGIQIINVAFGGTLFDDLPTRFPSDVTHRNSVLYDKCYHPVSIEPTSTLGAWLQKAEVTVNSVHHQGIRTVGDGLRVVASAADGLVEAVETPDGQVVAVQWHPEWDQSPIQRRLFVAFVQRCSS
jgi:putative glutamine amidotransferase